MRTYNIPVFIPHEGCPHDCVFCNQRKITGVQTTVTPAEVTRIVEEYLTYLPKGERYVEVAFFGGSFTGLPLAMQEAFYDAASGFRPQIDGIRLSTRPDYISPGVLALAKEYGVTMIELGAQSASDVVLCANNRGHTFAQTCKAVQMIRDAGIGVGLQMMTGMFGSDKEKDLETARLLEELKPDCVRIYPVLVLKDTALEVLYREEKYRPQTLETAVETAKEVLLEFRQQNIPVIRLGLHAGEDLREEGNVVAGPFHPAFGELVESRIWRDRMERQLCALPNRPASWTVTVPKNQVSKAVGHQRCNVNYFQQTYGIQLCVKSE